MGTLEELGRKADKLTESIKGAVREGMGRTGSEVKDWRKQLDGLTERIKKTTQEGLEKFTSETKGLGQMARIKPRIWQKRKRMEEKFCEMGKLAYRLHLEKRIGNPELKGMGAQITKIRKEIENIEREIKKPASAGEK